MKKAAYKSTPKDFLMMLLEEAGMDLVPEKVKEKYFRLLAKTIDREIGKVCRISKQQKLEMALAKSRIVSRKSFESVPNASAVFAKAVLEYRKGIRA